jgi:hypothetical protein
VRRGREQKRSAWPHCCSMPERCGTAACPAHSSPVFPQRRFSGSTGSTVRDIRRGINAHKGGYNTD